MDVLFTKKELAQGMIEPSKNNTRALDQSRVDLIKSFFLIYFSFFFDHSKFLLIY